MSNMQFLIVCGLILSSIGFLGLGILFLYKKLIGIINKKQTDLTNLATSKHTGMDNLVKNVKKDLVDLINNKQKEITNQINNRFDKTPNDLSYLVPYTGDKKTIVIARPYFNIQGGIATRWKTFFPYFEQAGYRVIIIMGLNYNCKELFNSYKTYFINFNSSNITEEIIRICNFENASLIEIHNEILNVNVAKVSSFLPIGFAAHSNIYMRSNIDYTMSHFSKLDEIYYKQLDFVVEVSGSRRDWYKNVKAEVIDFSIDTKLYIPVFKNANQKKALLVSRLSIEKLRNIEPFILECQKRGIAFDIIGVGDKKEYLQTTYNLADEIFLGLLNAVEYMSCHGTDYLFIAGASQVTMESMALGFPSLLVCEDSYFMTKQTFENALYYDFDKITESTKTLDKQFEDLYNDRLDDFNCRDLVVKHLDLETNAKKYIDIYENAMEKRNE